MIHSIQIDLYHLECQNNLKIEYFRVLFAYASSENQMGGLNSKFVSSTV